MATGSCLPSANRPQFLQKAMLATPLTDKIPALSGSSLCTHPAVKRVVHGTQEHSCHKKCPPWHRLELPCFCFLVSLLHPFTIFTISINWEGIETSFFFSFQVSSCWSSIHINNFSGRIMYSKACSNVSHSKSNWLLRTFVELLLSHHHLKRRKCGLILSVACSIF